MATVTGISIEFAGSGYTPGTSKVCLNSEHGPNDVGSNLFVDIMTNGNGSVLTATPTEAKTGLYFLVNQLVFVENINTTDLCILRITSVEPLP